MLPIKINTDLDPSSVPPNSSRLNVNINIDILKGSITNEQGFDIVSLTSDNREIIGNILLPDNSLCLFSTILNNPDYTCEIGILKDNRYSVVVKDNTIAGVNLGFNTFNLIQGQSKVNFNGDYIIYWVDGNNTDKWLNLNNPQIQTTSDLKILNVEQLNLLLSFTPSTGESPILSASDSGSLEAGVYQVAIIYGDKFQNFTGTNLFSYPIPIVASKDLTSSNSFIGSKAGTLTSKAINVFIDSTEINLEYSFLKVIVVSKINQTLKAYEFGTYSVTPSDFNCVIDTLVNKTEVSIDSVVINNAAYKSSLTITQLDDICYKAHLRSREEIDLQPYVNNIKVNYVQKSVNLKNVDSYKSPEICFYSKGFTYDETYALYVSFTVEDGGEYETKAYHIPGRPATNIDLGGTTNPLENTLLSDLLLTDYDASLYNTSGLEPFNQFQILNPESRLFNAVKTNDNSLATTNMGYYENKDEFYDTTEKWTTKDGNGNVISTALKGAKVRHHKFPEAYNYNTETLVPDLTKSMHPNNSNYSIVNILGISLSNIVIPFELNGKVKKINIYYAKRDLNNRTILGQSLLQSLSQIHNSNNAGFSTQNLVFNNGGQFCVTNMLQQNRQKTGGLFPVGYERTTAQAASNWWYSDFFYVNPSYWGKGYYKFKAFDLMNQTLDVSGGVYIKNLFRVKSLYKAIIAGGQLADQNDNWYTRFLYDPADIADSNYIRASYFGGIDRLVDNTESLSNSIRLVTNSSYVAQNFPNQREPTASPYPFVGTPYNYQGETSIWLETDNYLQSWNMGASWNQIGNDTATINYYLNGSFWTDNDTGLYASPYISNLCAFKLNLFQTFESQVLCLADSRDIDDTANIYNGDTFTSITSDKGSIDLAAWTPMGFPNKTGDDKPQNQLSSVHCYIVQSTSNPNYRYEGDNSWETFYPYASFAEVSGIPLSNPEWFGYNLDYSSVNDIKQPVIASNFDNQFQTYFPNRVIRSAKDNPELQQDNYLNFEAGDYKDFGKAKGMIRNITNQNNKLVIKTDNALFVTLGREVISTEGAEASITSGDIFATKPREVISSNSYGGGLGRFADVVNQYGYMYPDTTNGIVYNFNGESLDEISKVGQQIFFRNELKFKAPKKINELIFNNFPAYNPAYNYLHVNYYVTYNSKVYRTRNTGVLSIPTNNSSDWFEEYYEFTNIDSVINTQSVGVQAVFDYKYKRYILNKKDYIVPATIPNYIGNLPDTWSNSFNGKIVWAANKFYKIYGVLSPSNIPANARVLRNPKGSFTYYVYGLPANFVTDLNFVEDKFTIAYYPEAQGWVSFYTFYPDAFMSTIDKVYSFTTDTNTKLYQHNSDLQNSLFYNRETAYSSFVEPILNEPKGVNRTSSFSIKANSYRKNKTLDYLKMFTSFFVRNSYQISETSIINNNTNSRNAEGYFNINDFRDMTRDNSAPLMTTDIINEPNSNNLNSNKHWSKQKKFVDYYIIPRLSYDIQFELVNLSLTYTKTTNSFNGTFEIGDIIKLLSGGVIYVYRINDATTNTVDLLSMTGLIANTTVTEYYVLPTRELNLLDVNKLENKNTR